jgi:Ca2+-binding RTX toxin-like protein
VGSLAPALGGTVNSIVGKLVINGQSTESETLNVDDSGDSDSNNATLTSTRLTGLGMAGDDPDGGIEYLGVDTLNIYLGSGADSLTIQSTAGATQTTVNDSGGASIVNIQTIASPLTLNGSSDSDTFNVGSLAPDSGGTVNGIGALLRLNGNAPDSGSDVLNLDDTGDSDNNTGSLTSTTITGLGLSPAGIVYTGIEHLIISLGSGDDSFTINSTHGSSTPVFQEDTTLNTGPGSDTVDIFDVTDLLFVNGEADGDHFNVNSMGTGSTTTLHGNDGNDVFNVRAMDGDVTVSGDGDDDTINVGSEAPALPSSPTSQRGTIDLINGLLTVDGGSGSNDVLNVDDSDPGNDAKSGTLTASTIRGLELEQGIDYSNLDTLNIWLAFGDNTFNIDSTHTGETTVNTAQGEDTIHINDASGLLVVNGEAGADTVNVNLTGSGSVAVLNGDGDDDVFNIRDMDGRVHVSGGAGNDTVNAADTGQNLDQIQGALILEGGELAVAGTDTLNIFHANNDDADTGHLFYRTMGDGGAAILNPGLALTGFGMGGDSGEYGGGITYNGFEIVEVLLGTGDETLTIDDTGDSDEKAALDSDPAAITVIHGGGGNDTITITDRGNGALVVYGDAGNDTIDGSAMSAKSDAFVGIVIDGGADNDTVIGTQDDDQLAGGSDSDTVTGEAGIDHIYGDSQFSVDVQLFAQDQQQRFDTDTELNLIDAMFAVITTGAGDVDILGGGAGDDVVFGDHGIVGQTEGTRRIESTGNVILLQTVNLANGGGDEIHGGGGNDLIFGGAGDDILYGDSDSDLIFGDFGTVAGDVDASAVGQIDGAGVQNPGAVFLYTSDISMDADVSAGDDTIYGGSLAVLDTDSGTNILLGQQGSDSIYGGGSDDDIYGGHNVANGADAGDFIDGAAGNDVIIGDNGLIEHTAAATDPRFTVLTGTQIYDQFGNPLVADGGMMGENPAGVEARRVMLFDHDDSTDNAGKFGDDTIAGGADDDVIFGQLGDDTIHGDGMLVSGALVTLAETIDGSDAGGDDYIEGNGGGDTIYGGLGQDDIAGGSSDFYNLITAAMRPGGTDTIFGGNGDRTDRNDDGEGGHGLDSDAIVGDNGNILRLVGIGGVDGGSLLAFNYDTYGGVKIVVRAVQLLDYTPGGPDYSGAALSDIGDADEIHGESGDDFIYGQKGSDVLFGDAGDDDIIAGYGNDWISGGTGDDGVIGDDGRIYTSRNSTAEPLNGVVVATVETFISTPGDFQQATINVLGQLKKSVDLTPFSQDSDWAATADEFYGISSHTSDDILYGGLGDDWLHGGSGDDAISGAEALPEFYSAPANSGNALGYSPATGTFAAFDEFAPMTLIDGFFLNFAEGDGPEVISSLGTVYTDGDDRIFGDSGNDWLVGGTGRDNLYGGWGNDLLNADDDQTTNGGLNDMPDTQPTYEDRAYGGAGRDVLIANTEGDRLIDWAGQFNSYIVPFAQSGMGTISRTLQPHLAEFLYALSLSDGADPTRAADTGADPVRNGEPFGELGVVRPQDFAWQDQTGAEPEMLLGVIPEGKREVLRSATFDGPQSTTAGGFSTANGFSPDSGTWNVANGALQVSADSPAGDAVSVFHVGDVLPTYFEIQASVLAVKPTGGWNANSFIIFDYQGENDFKFAGIDVSTNKLVMGHRDAGGWHVDEQASVQGGLKADKYYNMTLAVNGSNATLVVDNQMVFTHTYQPRVVEGYSYGLNWGLVGVGSNNARGMFDNVRVQILPPQLTFDETEDFEGDETLSFSETSGLWSVGTSVYTSTSTGTASLSMLDIGPDNLAYSSYLELSAVVNTDGRSGFVFDRYDDGSFKFAVIDTDSGEAIIGHYTTKSGWVYDAVVSVNVSAGTSYTLGVALKGTTVSLTLDGQTILGYSFNASVVDGGFGLLSIGMTSFDNVRVKTNDPVFL